MSLTPPPPGDRLGGKREFLVPMERRVRTVRLEAKPIGLIPEWHAAVGRTA